ncbi:MAG: ATP-binding protein [Thermodesulfobacteriota bacterium]
MAEHAIPQASPSPTPRQAWRPSIRTYLILINLVLLCLLFPAVSAIFLNEDAKFRDAQLKRTINQMRSSLESRSGSLARSMSLSAGQAVAGYDFTFLNAMVQQVAGSDPEILYVLVMDGERRVMAHSDPRLVGAILEGEIDLQAAALFRTAFAATLTADGQDQQPRFIDRTQFRDEEGGSGPLLEVLAPIYSGNTLWGVLRCGYSLRGLHREIAATATDWTEKMRQFKKYFFTITGIFFSVGVAVAALFTRLLVQAMHVLSAGVQRVSEGDLHHDIKPDRLFCDEFLHLAASFNVMTQKLKHSYQQLDEYSRSLEQKVQERTRELSEAQSHLLQQAHEAGMAEMAVGVVHNIGNAITPAKVSATLLLNNLRQSPLQHHVQEAMQQISATLKAAPAIDEAERQRLLAVTSLLPQSFQEEQERIIRDVSRIEQKHEHIEDIIALQMRYAHLTGDTKEINLNVLVDDALRMLEDTLGKHAVQVERNFAVLPPVRAEQSKLMQTVINLLKNGYEAMEQVKAGERRLTITTALEPGPPAAVLLSVRDNGIGFTDEEKAHFFQFGYSSKGRGSGFGLHTCANYLIANHGSISAWSGGRGKGAEFVIRLPAMER